MYNVHCALVIKQYSLVKASDSGSRLPWAVMDRCSRPGREPTTVEAVGNQWRYALTVVQAGEEEEEVTVTVYGRGDDHRLHRK